jgi:hypothetical protein
MMHTKENLMIYLSLREANLREAKLTEISQDVDYEDEYIKIWE